MPPTNAPSLAHRPRSRSRANQRLLLQEIPALTPRAARFNRLQRRSVVEQRRGGLGPFWGESINGGSSSGAVVVGGGGGGGELPSASKEVERAIDYLATVRLCRSPEESLRLAVRAGFHSGEDWLELFEQQPKCDDFVLDTAFLKVQETSYLRAGGVFWGEQVAPSPCLHPAATGSQWSVRVGIESIEYSQLRLTGTMEAFTDGDGKTNIKTYFEGEILDFNKHSFKTLSFNSSLYDDANNWRKLDPFVRLSNSELVRCLTSRKYMMDLNAKWLFLRIKEHCFLNPDPDVGGLTIGGFYYLSLRRDDGRIHGYYYDPQSQPFQELTLMPEKRLFPSYEFR